MSTIHVRRRPRLRSATGKFKPEERGTQCWLEDPSIPICAEPDCRFDLGSCEHNVTVTKPKKRDAPEPNRDGWV